ncbi:MAG: threonine ammonia-lyase IlvA [Chitinophagales bacterium]|jgi:threonine dehydratase|nr:threonine ammonia-lyase IlvA [Chitinophagales bacterium]
MISVENIIKASYRLNGIVQITPLQHNPNLSERHQCNVFLKREDLQPVRSYKIRGAYNRMLNLTPEQAQQGVVCASAGNHAQGVAYACQQLGIQAEIYMPTTTPSQKIRQVERIGKNFVHVVLAGDTYDAAYSAAQSYCDAQKKVFIHPFDDSDVIEGQGTVAVDILNTFKGDIDYLFVPIGGGGLSAGVGTYFQRLSPKTQIIGVEPMGAPAMKQSLEKNERIMLEAMDNFVDGAAVRRVGEINFDICKNVLHDIVLVPEGRICTIILQLYNEDALVVEPAGALSIAALDFYADKIKGKNVVCVVSGGNNDIERMPEIKERSMIYEGLKHYFIINFPQRPNALLDFLSNILCNGEDIAVFQYTKKNNRSIGPALIGIEIQQRSDYESLLQRLDEHKIDYKIVNNDQKLFEYLI